MSGNSTSGYGSEEPQCYNCGAQGHWAVACPEPTRQTPAGLAAWRNASNARPGSSNGGGRDRRGLPKKHKGPIITKYGLPPAPQPPPPPPQGSSYPPSNAVYPTHAPYPSAGLSVPPPPPPPLPPSVPPGYHHYPPPPAGYPPVQPPSDYPPHHHVDSHYPPTPPGPPQGYPQLPPYSYDTKHMHGYPHQQPPPPSLSQYGPSPPGYRAYPERGPEPQRYPPPPLPPPSYGSSSPANSYGHSRNRSHGHPADQHPRPPRSNHPGERSRKPPQTPPAKRNSGSQSRGSSVTSGPIQLPTPLIHSLPPKPPQSRSTQPEVQRGKQNKRNQDRKNRQRGNKQRDANKNNDRERKGQESSVANGIADRPPSTSGVSVENQSQATTELVPPVPEPQKAGVELSQEVTPPQEQASEPAAPAPGDTQEASPGLAESSDQEDDPWEWDFNAIFKEPEAKHAPDEVGRPLPFAYHEDVLLPRKWDAVSVVSEYVNPNNLGEYVRPVHETEYWAHIELDPAFVVDGQLPCGEPIPTHLRTGEQPPNRKQDKDTSPTRVDRHESRKRSLQHDPVEDDNGKRATKRRRPSDVRKKDSYVPNYGRSVDRSRSRERRSPSRDSAPRSRRSSASSLNSLEAALLGISENPKSPAEGRSPSPPPSHRRDESSRSPQMKRRRPRTESAYSRRW